MILSYLIYLNFAGSLTDSICTAYENKASKLSEISEATDSGFDESKVKTSLPDPFGGENFFKINYFSKIIKNVFIIQFIFQIW